MTQLSKKTRDDLAALIVKAAQMGRTHNPLDEQSAAIAVCVLDSRYQIRLPSLQRAREIAKWGQL